jgi:hypothetical protein
VVHPRLAAFFRALAADGLAWSLLRGESELDGRPGDIDILVAPGDLRSLRRVAKSAGFVRLPSQGYGSHLFLIAYDRDSDRWLKLDVVTELGFGPAFAWRIGDGASVLERTRRGDANAPGAWVLADTDAFWALILHGLLDKRRLDEAKRARLGELTYAAREGGPLARALAPLLPEGWEPRRVVDAVERRQWDRLEQLGTELETVLRRRHRIGTARQRVGARAGRRMGRLARARRPRGLTVALVGDAGLVGWAAAELGQAVPIPVRSLAFAPRSRWPLRWLRMRPVSGFRIRLQRGTGLVIYRAASLADLPGRGGSPANLLFCPPPDLVILLNPSRPSAPAGEARGTQPQPGIRPDISTVDPRLPEGEVRRSIAGLVWDRLADRWDALDRRSAKP